MKKYLMIEFAPITDEQKVERELYALYEDEVRRVYFAHGQWLDCETACPVYEAPTHYLPNGIPSPDQSVEVFESEVAMTNAQDPDDHNDEELYQMDFIKIPKKSPLGGNPQAGAKVGVFVLPIGKVEVRK